MKYSKSGVICAEHVKTHTQGTDYLGITVQLINITVNCYIKKDIIKIQLKKKYTGESSHVKYTQQTNVRHS